MIRSMTGFGDAAGDAEGVHYFVELRSLNSRYFKSSIRLPEFIQALEPEIEAILRRRLHRGTVTLSVKATDTSAAAAWVVNQAALSRYLEQLRGLAQTDADDLRIDAAALLALPGALQPDGDDERRLHEARATLLPLVKRACDRLLDMRQREGALLKEELERHHAEIADLLERIARRAPTIVEAHHSRLRERVETMLRDAGAVVEQVDLIREVAIYAEKIDIAEEVARLGGHLDQFREIVEDASSRPVGRTLDFLAQEMLREANTIAGKSNDVEVSRHIVAAKGAIDRIKEQVQNVE